MVEKERDSEMAIRHILRDGTEVADVAGRVVRLNEFGTVYAVIQEINRKERKNEERDRGLHPRGGVRVSER